MLNYNLLMKEISDIKNCYFIYSYDEKLVSNFIKSVENVFVLRELRQFNYISMRFDTNFDITRFFEACDTIPVMQERKIVVLENALFLRNDYENKEIISKVRDYLKNIAPYCIVIIYYIFKDQDKNKDLLKSFSGLGQVCKINELRGEDFYKEVQRIFFDKKVSIKPAILKYFCERVNNDFFHIENEIDKLKVFVGDDEVTKQNIDDIIPRSFENNIFNFINNVFERDLRKSLTTLKELIVEGNEFNYIFSMLSGQFSKFLDVKMLVEYGKTSEEINKITKLNPYVVKNFMKFSSRYGLEQIVDIIDKFLDMDYKLRSNNFSDALTELEIILVSICKKY